MPSREAGLKFILKAVGYLPNTHASITSVDTYFLTSWYCVMWHPKLCKTLIKFPLNSLYVAFWNYGPEILREKILLQFSLDLWVVATVCGIFTNRVMLLSSFRQPRIIVQQFVFWESTMTNLITISKNPVWFYWFLLFFSISISLISAPFFNIFFHLLFLDLICSYLLKSLIYINKLFIGDCSDIFNGYLKLQVPLLGLLLLYLIASGMLCLHFSLYSLFKFLHWHCHHYVHVLFNLHEFMHCFVVFLGVDFQLYYVTQ